MRKDELNVLLQEFGKVQGQMEGVQISLEHGSSKMNDIIAHENEVAGQIIALKAHCEQTHIDCGAIHQAVSAGCLLRKANTDDESSNSKGSKITMSFNNLMKLLGFVAVIATCGMVAAGNWG